MVSSLASPACAVGKRARGGCDSESEDHVRARQLTTEAFGRPFGLSMGTELLCVTNSPHMLDYKSVSTYNILSIEIL
jgi:hypothetical protein